MLDEITANMLDFMGMISLCSLASCLEAIDPYLP